METHAHETHTHKQIVLINQFVLSANLDTLRVIMQDKDVARKAYGKLRSKGFFSMWQYMDNANRGLLIGFLNEAQALDKPYMAEAVRELTRLKKDKQYPKREW